MKFVFLILSAFLISSFKGIYFSKNGNGDFMVISNQTNDSVDYRFHKNGKLRARIVDSSGIKGYQVYTENGILEKVYFEIKGRREGKYTQYFTNDSSKGQIFIVSNYKEGKLYGLYYLYRPKPINVKINGSDSIVYKFNYVNGKLTGPTYTNYQNKQYFLSYYCNDALLIQYEYRILDDNRTYFDFVYLEKKIKRRKLDFKVIRSELDTWMYLMPISYYDYHH